MKMLLLPSFLIVWTLSITSVFPSTEVVKESQDLVNSHSGSDILDDNVVTVRSLSIYLHCFEFICTVWSNIWVHSILRKDSSTFLRRLYLTLQG